MGVRSLCSNNKQTDVDWDYCSVNSILCFCLTFSLSISFQSFYILNCSLIVDWQLIVHQRYSTFFELLPCDSHELPNILQNWMTYSISNGMDFKVSENIEHSKTSKTPLPRYSHLDPLFSGTLRGVSETNCNCQTHRQTNQPLLPAYIYKQATCSSWSVHSTRLSQNV